MARRATEDAEGIVRERGDPVAILLDERQPRVAPSSDLPYASAEVAKTGHGHEITTLGIDLSRVLTGRY